MPRQERPEILDMAAPLDRRHRQISPLADQRRRQGISRQQKKIHRKALPGGEQKSSGQGGQHRAYGPPDGTFHRFVGTDCRNQLMPAEEPACQIGENVGHKAEGDGKGQIPAAVFKAPEGDEGVEEDRGRSGDRRRLKGTIQPAAPMKDHQQQRRNCGAAEQQ